MNSNNTRRPASTGYQGHNPRPAGSRPPSTGGPRRPSTGGYRGPSAGRPSFGGKPRFGGGKPRFGGGRPKFGGSNRGGGRGGFSGQNIHFSKFINKAEPVAEEVPYTPDHQFNDFIIDQKLKANIAAKGYVNPTLVQDKTIPHILAGRDVVGIANTGTGKTGAFLIPLIEKVFLNKHERIMIIVPTRELAVQINEELRSFVPNLGIYSTVCVGGMSMGSQISSLKHRTNHFIIGTPGRLKDLVDRRFIDLSKFATIVLDEADRMLDMGFINDMKYVMSKMPAKRHTLFFSATMSREIEALIKQFLHEPVMVSVKTGDTSKNVDQDIVRVGGADKIEVLQGLLKDQDFSKVIIFGKTKHGVEKLSNKLVERGFKADSIHGDKPHSRRQRALNAFKDNSLTILVATDVAARGLDIPNVSHVINYDVPATYEDYVHRIGRTGRGGKKGKALTFIDGHTA